jgi:hypothetical protein
MGNKAEADYGKKTEPLREMIMEYIIRKSTGATWSELKTARVNLPRMRRNENEIPFAEIKRDRKSELIADPVLKRVVDQLTAEGWIEPHAELRKNKALTIYMVKKSPFQMANERGCPSVFIWIRKTIRKFKEKRLKVTLPDEIYHPNTYTSLEVPDTNYKIPEDQGEALATAVQWLALVILGEIEYAATDPDFPDEDARIQHLKSWTRFCFTVLISEILRLASHDYGDPKRAFEDARARLGRKELFRKIFP